MTTRLYETMFLLDNQLVREDWAKAKAVVTDTLTKHGGKVLSARRWDERRLAYPIQGKRRATFVLTYHEMASENEHGIALRRDLELNERVLRFLMLQVEKMPEGELEKAQAESAADFVVPAPPPDDAPDIVERLPMREEGRRDELDVAVPDLNNLVEEEV